MNNSDNQSVISSGAMVDQPSSTSDFGQPAALNQCLNPQEHLAQWQDAARALKAETLSSISSIPVVNYLEEADGLAFFVEKYWNAKEPGQPGLSSVQAFMSFTISQEIRSLVQACRMVQSQLLFPEPVDSSWATLVQQGKSITAELRAALEFVLDDDLIEDSDLALQGAWKRESDDHSMAALAQALSDYAGIAERNADKLNRLHGFDSKVIAQARLVANQLTAQGPQYRAGRPASELVDLRNRLLTLLDQRVSTVRRAARFVFRQYPEIYRLAGSEYLRRKRAEQRQRKLTEENPAETQSAPNASTPA